MNALDLLATAALMGTERRAPELPLTPEPLTALLQKLSTEPPERALLCAAAALGTCALAGFAPQQVEIAPAPAPLDDADRHATPPALEQALAAIFEDGPERLQAEACRTLARASHLLPLRLLPRALVLGRKSVALRPWLMPVLGARGAWLAQQNDAWSHAALRVSASASDEQLFAEGTLDQRRAALEALRVADPAHARTLLSAALPHEGARERAALLATLVTSLSIADEDLLEPALADRSREVRLVAARLLSTLADSRFGARMVARVRACWTPAADPLHASIEAPSAYDPTWKPDAIEQAPPKGTKLGERAWWLLQLVQWTPLHALERMTSMDPLGLLRCASNSDWSHPVLRGFVEAQQNQRRRAWAEALLSFELPAEIGPSPLELVAMLPPDERGPHLVTLMRASASRGISLSGVLDPFLLALPYDAPSLAPTIAATVVARLREGLSDERMRHDWELSATLVEVACVLPLAELDELAAGLDLSSELSPLLTDALAHVARIAAQRRMLEAAPSIFEPTDRGQP